MRSIVCLFFIFITLQASAEYRVFRLVISKRAPASAPTATQAVGETTAPANPPALTEALPPATGREIISTLDPDQYPTYYQVRDDEFVSYTQTWMCKGRTGNFREPCAAPEAPIAAEPPAVIPAPATSSDTP